MFTAFTIPEENRVGFVMVFDNGYSVSIAFKEGTTTARTVVGHGIEAVQLAGRDLYVEDESAESVAELIMRVATLPSR